ncbi:sulfatase [Algoriphagus sp. AK58]|uniref:sulfatase n=1 Tax=Algoriphagus sp. AK58 TaxID=1406877 RepID=UPI00164F3209|nr:sulfatase [Algoriphagus sp. AK58]MBC6367025.1 sulfatase [Algoriphagus sp. AK58]
MRAFILWSILILFSLTGFSQEKTKLNVILIHVDDLGATDLGAFGSDFYETPHIDRLAREGMKFVQSYSAAAICSPSRAALMTGKYPARTGITDWIRAKFQGGSGFALPTDLEENEGQVLKTPKNQGFLPQEEETIAERMKSLGFTTLHVGKWHLGEEGNHPENQGFDLNIGGNDLGQPSSYFDPYLAKNEDPSYVLKNVPSRKEGEFLTDREGDEIVKFIQNRPDPFFIHWAPYAVHTPIMGPEVLVEKYKAKTPGIQKNPIYAALVENLDQNVGKVLAELDRLGLRKNTLIIFTSDNGGLIGNPQNPVTVNLGLRSFKGYPYEGGIRVPTIVSLPGRIPSGTVSQVPIITMDWVPTILDIEGEKKAGTDGVSLTSVLFQKEALADRDLFWHFPHYREPDVKPYSIVRSGQYKLIYYFESEEVELFDLSKDPLEQTNLANQLPKLVVELKSKLEKWWRETGARLPVKN